MNKIKVIHEREVLGKQFRIYGTFEEPLFLAKDIAEWIEHTDVSTMLKTVDNDEKLTQTMFVSGQNRQVWMLTENGVYEVLMQSRKPIAKEFKKQVKEILHTIRKTGGYVGNDEMFVNNYLPFADDNTKALFKLTLQTIKQQNELIEKQNKKIEQDKPFVQFAAHVSNSDNAIDMETFSKILHDKNIRIGRNRLFELLKYNKYLTKFNLPYQKYVDAGYFKVLEVPYQIGNKKFIRAKTVITGKGQIYFFNKIKDLYDVDKIK